MEKKSALRGLLLLTVLLLGAGSGVARGGDLGLTFGRALESQETDTVRLTYRSAWPWAEGTQPWWEPKQLQSGVSVWRVPDIAGRARRVDLNLTPIWQADTGFGVGAQGYMEAGLGAYLLSKTINNGSNQLSSAFQFGSHLAAGLRFGARGETTAGIAVQHLSNAGIKHPNGGINFVLLHVAVSL
jgi:Lipid A 3-O-deacylase (PagL)